MRARVLAFSWLLLVGADGPLGSTLKKVPPTWEAVFAGAEIAFVGVVVATEPQLVYHVLERFVGEPEEEFAFRWRDTSRVPGQVELVFGKRRTSREGTEYWAGLGRPRDAHLPLTGWEGTDAVARTRAWAAEHPLRSTSGSRWARYSLPEFEFGGADEVLHYTARCTGERTVEYTLYGSGRLATMNVLAENVWPPGDHEFRVSSRTRDRLLRQMAMSGLFDELGGREPIAVQLFTEATTEDLPSCRVTLEVSLRSYTDSNGSSRPIHQTLDFDRPARPEDYSTAAERRRVTALAAITRIVENGRPWWRRERRWPGPSAGPR